MRFKSFSLRTASSSILLACSFMTFTQTAMAFADDDARKAIVDLRQQVKNMQEANQRARMQLADQIEALEQEVARLRGEMEQLGRPGGSQGGRAAEAKANDPREQAAYDQAMEAYRKGQYKEATTGLMNFMVDFPDSPLTPSALFYQGSSRYAQKDFKGAITQLQGMAQKYPDHPRAPDALMIVAGSQIELNDRAAAKATLQRIVKTYKGTPAADTAAKRLQLLQ
ncbi:tol-pal system protein YbgF [Orrella sp. NBD-18]|uniref:Cell division coordinator CpoB n=1 Tax=Sheuella amnicola TaxID=2707330 RepID=A0A6B2R7B8_9BURK|nr:tol-pal system protein YbgF [Sheuella amnicola]NDY83235.1 tol-pal system protein YbgF [Sheuella amnicola]